MSHLLRPLVLFAAASSLVLPGLAPASELAAAPIHKRGASAPASSAPASAAHRSAHRAHAGASGPGVMCGGMASRRGHADMSMHSTDAASQPMMGMDRPCMASSAPAP